MRNSFSINKGKINEKSIINVPLINDCNDIFHYTSTEGLRNILQTKKLWFSGIQYLNDANEIKEGIKAIRDYFDMLDDGQDYSKLKPISDMFFEHLERNVLNVNVFVCSFSFGNDELPLWRYYTKDNICQGYNICFSLEKLLQTLIKQNLELLDGCYLTYGNAIYYDRNEQDEIEKIVNGILYKFAEKYPTISKQILMASKKIFELFIKLTDKQNIYFNEQVDSVILEAQTIEKYLANIYWFDTKKICFEKSMFADPTFYIKNKTFESEKEIRIVIQIPDDKMKDIQDKIKFRTCNGILVPYLEMEFGTEAIDGFNLSPTLKNDIVERGLRKYIDCCGFDINKMEYGIQKSQIPLRY
ncbi:MAG: DUF2971 domain-containing protein [Lachnospiraceae bacterium]|nr:DUF2971 domain-containing protein [Lachnospiraceae bacterium]